MPTLSEYANVHNTSLNILAEKGYQLWLDPETQLYFAEKDGWDFASDSPGGLLGMVTIFEYHQPSEYEEYWWRKNDQELFGKLPSAPKPYVHAWDKT